MRRQNGFVPGVDVIAYGLADEVGGDGEAGEAGLLQEGPFLFAVGFFVQGAGDVKVVAPAGEFEAVEAEGPGFFGEGGEGQIGPLAGEVGDGTGLGGLLGKMRDLENVGIGVLNWRS